MRYKVLQGDVRLKCKGRMGAMGVSIFDILQG